MRVFYDQAYNIDFGFINRIHPFDGTKFRKVADAIEGLAGARLESPEGPIAMHEIDSFVDALLKLLLRKKRYILRALELPYVPFIPMSFIDRRILLPMRWGVAGTSRAARAALAERHICWNLAGGYHHASRAAAEGFCIYNDVGITVEALRRDGLLADDARILIIDIDAHHGNGNAYVFMEAAHVTILDIYNQAIYPQNAFTRDRVNINIPLDPGTGGNEYLDKLERGLSELQGVFDLAFVVAGTDVLSSDRLGGLGLSIGDCVKRDGLVFEKLRSLSTPAVFLGGGGYSGDSAEAIIGSLKMLCAAAEANVVSE